MRVFPSHVIIFFQKEDQMHVVAWKVFRLWYLLLISVASRLLGICNSQHKTLALGTLCYHGHPAMKGKKLNPRPKLQRNVWQQLSLLRTPAFTELRTLHVTPKQQFYCSIPVITDALDILNDIFCCLSVETLWRLDIFTNHSLILHYGMIHYFQKWRNSNTKLEIG